MPRASNSSDLRWLMPAEPGRASTGGVAGLAAIGVAACCGLPALLSLGAGVTIAGLGLRSWMLILAGAVAAASGVVVMRRRRRAACAPGTTARKRD